MISSLKSRDIEIKAESKAEGLSARGRSQTRNFGNSDFDKDYLLDTEEVDKNLN